VAFGAGILSFLSPCVLPLVPGYLSMVSGLSAAELTASGAGDGPSSSATTFRPMLRGIALFVGGFTIVFVSLGAVASGIGHVLVSHKETLTHVSGYVVVLLGLVLLLTAVPGQFWSRLGSGPTGLAARITGERRFQVRPSTLGIWAAPVMGMAFAFAWTPCIGPVLGVVLGLAAHNGTLAGGALLLFAYSLGLGVPFAITGLAFGRLTAVLARARRGAWIVEVVAGVILVTFGILLVTDHLGWVSGQFSNLLKDIGLGRLSTS
jgi:cytochrome c-type biogenesis protein